MVYRYVPVYDLRILFLYLRYRYVLNKLQVHPKISFSWGGDMGREAGGRRPEAGGRRRKKNTYRYGTVGVG